MKYKTEISLKVYMLIDTGDYDDDINWENPANVIKDQIDCEGIRDFLYAPLEMESCEITNIKMELK